MCVKYSVNGPKSIYVNFKRVGYLSYERCKNISFWKKDNREMPIWTNICKKVKKGFKICTKLLKYIHIYYG